MLAATDHKIENLVAANLTKKIITFLTLAHLAATLPDPKKKKRDIRW